MREPTYQNFRETAWRDGAALTGSRQLAEEVAVAISFNGSTHAVLMATPADLEDLATGFSLTEGIIDDLKSVEDITVERYELGIDVQVRVHEDIAAKLAQRRRSMVGPAGCGLCGLESLEEATRCLARVTAETVFTPKNITFAVQSINALQTLNRATSAAHAAGFFVPGEAVTLVREDIGRHNAVDKVIGAMARTNVAAAKGGLAVTSRISVELVQKAAVAGCGLLAAISAPTAYAVRTAEAANITLAAVVRGESFEIFSGLQRIAAGEIADVA